MAFGIGLAVLAAMSVIDYEFGISVISSDDYRGWTLGIVIAVLQVVIVTLIGLLVMLESD